MSLSRMRKYLFKEEEEERHYFKSRGRHGLRSSSKREDMTNFSFEFPKKKNNNDDFKSDMNDSDEEVGIPDDVARYLQHAGEEDPDDVARYLQLAGEEDPDDVARYLQLARQDDPDDRRQYDPDGVTRYLQLAGEEDAKNGGGDDGDNNGGGGKDEKKDGSDENGNGNNDKGEGSGSGGGNGNMKRKQVKPMFGCKFGYHAGNENWCPVEQLQGVKRVECC